jgi:exodeoxyribonuclease-5
MALRAWQLPEVAPLHGSLQAEVEVAGVEQRADGTTVYWGGVADAIALSEDGAARLVLDWKSDRNPSPETLEHYRHQLRAYLKLTGAVEGMIVLASLGRVERVAPE